MLNKKEIIVILAATLVLGFAISFLKTTETFLYTLLMVFVIFSINIAAKKIVSFYFESEIEVKIWQIRKYWYRAHDYFKRPFPAGVFLPIIFSVLTFGGLTWMAPLVFEVKPKIYRAAKRHGLYSFSEMTEAHIGFIAAAGIIANLLFAVIGYLLGVPDFARLNIYFAFFNMLPLSSLDGNKIFFGSLVLWSFLAAIVLIGVGYALLLV